MFKSKLKVCQRVSHQTFPRNPIKTPWNPMKTPCESPFKSIDIAQRHPRHPIESSQVFLPRQEVYTAESDEDRQPLRRSSSLQIPGQWGTNENWSKNMEISNYIWFDDDETRCLLMMMMMMMMMMISRIILTNILDHLDPSVGNPVLNQPIYMKQWHLVLNIPNRITNRGVYGCIISWKWNQSVCGVSSVMWVRWSY